jgi:hypothetical protein
VFLDYNLQNYVPIPTTDDAPVISLRRGDVVVSVVWKDAAGSQLPESFAAFEEGVEYQADITLTPNTNNGFFFDPEISFYYPPGSVKVPPDAGVKNTGARTLSVGYNPTETAIVLDEVNLSGIATPWPGTPAASYVVQEEFSGLVIWTPAASSFMTDVEYAAAAMLYPGPGYVFGKKPQVTHPESTATPTLVGSSPDLSIAYGGGAANSRAAANGRSGAIVVTVGFAPCGSTPPPGTPGTPTPPTPPPPHHQDEENADDEGDINLNPKW